MANSQLIGFTRLCPVWGSDKVWGENHVTTERNPQYIPGTAIMQKAEKRLTAILKRAKSSGISPEKLLDLDAIKAIYGAEKSRKGSKRWNAVVLVASIGMVVSLVFFYADSEVGKRHNKYQ